VALDLSSSLSPSEVVNTLLERALDEIDADRGTLSTLDGEEIVIEASLDRSERMEWIGARYPVAMARAQGPLREALQQRRPVVGSAFDADAAAPELRGALRRVRHTLSVPLPVGGEPEALLVLSRREDRAFTPVEIENIEVIANAAGVALRNARLFRDLHEASRAKTDFLNLAAHELRTPLAVINGYVSMLIDGSFGEPPSGWEVPLRVLADKSAELGTLVDSLLVAARLQAGSLKARPDRIRLDDAVRDAVARASGAAQLAGGRITAASLKSDVVVDADSEHLARMLDNLLANAVIYSARAPQVRVRLEVRGGDAVVEVNDRGLGIPEPEWERIFEQFVRVENEEFGYPAGTGLGLYIARQLARRHGGDVRVATSRPGKGSTFELLLPVAAPTQAEQLTRSADSGLASQEADDSPLARRSY
jgi:signal transduction histidine kinase